MSNISTVEAELPPGFRFHPKDDELVCDYLLKKITCNSDSLLIIEVDLNKCEPWDIPEIACVGGKEWYFYSQRDRKYATGLRTNRATASGYWKATGKDRPVLRKNTLVGMRKTLVFYQGRAPKGRKTDWVMHEFRLEGSLSSSNNTSPKKEDWVLCRVFYKNREVTIQPSMGSCYDETASPSLPLLMDSYITFDQTQLNLNLDEYEQVPCFSTFPQSQIFPHTLSMTTCPNLDTFSCDKKVIKAVLNQLNQVETNPKVHGSPSLGEGSSESYLSEEGISKIWTNHY
ncbi:hypothetical protein MANES_15G102650v8 [Manihot esculenta]|uniref:Uncharacterized protein n=2 Tax=Manihot esculenta TaxID=3983 RepID=A0ACB7GAK6_MANES|nr:NAC transcription factors 79 [Manihot esculenta]KAG8637282.1 hypothetical protein MANES_15G102650v8 [Manihot esculenta]